MKKSVLAKLKKVHVTCKYMYIVVGSFPNFVLNIIDYCCYLKLKN